MIGSQRKREKKLDVKLSEYLGLFFFFFLSYFHLQKYIFVCSSHSGLHVLLSKSEVAYKFPELLPLVSSKSKYLLTVFHVFELSLKQRLLVMVLQRNRSNKESVCACTCVHACMYVLRRGETEWHWLIVRNLSWSCSLKSRDSLEAEFLHPWAEPQSFS